jgi:hypothetical protein
MMTSRPSLSLLSTAIAVAFLPSGILAGTPQESFDFLFGKEAAQVAASKDKAASIDFAGRILAAAATTKDDAALQRLLYEKAYEFASVGPAGQATALAAARTLSVIDQDRKSEWQEKVLVILRSQQATLRTPAERNASNQAIAEQLVLMAETQSEAGSVEKMALYCQQAQGTIQALPAGSAKDDLLSRLKPVQARIAPLRQAEQLKAKLAADPRNKTVAESLVHLYLVDMDNPEEASKYAELGADETVRRNLLVAAMNVDGLPEAACLALADWYDELVNPIKGPTRAAMMRRVLAYSEQYIRLHPADDITNKKAKLLYEKAQKELKQSGEAAIVDLMKYVDPKQDFLGGSWSLRGGVLVGSGRPACLQFPYHPPEEYDFEITFTMARPSSSVSMILVGPGTQFSWSCPGYDSTVVGFELVNGAEVNKNPSAAKIVMAPGAKHVSLVQVRKDSVKGFLDGKLMVDWKTDFKDMSIYGSYRQADTKCLGLAVWYDPVTFLSARVTEIGGRGKVLRDPIATTPAPSGTSIIKIPGATVTLPAPPKP